MNLEELNSLRNNPKFQEFIKENINSDTNKLRLKKFKECSFDVKFAILQIECKNRIKKKLPEIYQSNSFFFPNILSTEQCTAQEIAQFHAKLLSSQDTVLDMTAGLCIDTYYISKSVKHVTAFEINKETALIADFNMKYHTDNVIVLCQDSTEFMQTCSQQYDVIFIDPARRDNNNKRLFGLSDCKPNIIEQIPILKTIGKTLYIKASPMIDISQSVKDLNNCVSDIWIIGINNECKELLFKVDLKCNDTVNANIHTINFDDSEIQTLTKSISTSRQKHNHTLYNNECYLYEPNRCIMKAQIFDTLENTYQVSQIQKNSHLFISNEYIPKFPGRKFQIIDIIPFKNNEIKNITKKHPQINVSVRNFKLSADELKKRLKVKDGGNQYLFGTTDNNDNAILIICDKIS